MFLVFSPLAVISHYAPCHEQESDGTLNGVTLWLEVAGEGAEEFRACLTKTGVNLNQSIDTGRMLKVGIQWLSDNALADAPVQGLRMHCQLEREGVAVWEQDFTSTGYDVCPSQSDFSPQFRHELIKFAVRQLIWTLPLDSLRADIGSQRVYLFVSGTWG